MRRRWFLVSPVLVVLAVALVTPGHALTTIDPAKTPGATVAAVTQENVATTICSATYVKAIRRVSAKRAAHVYDRYHVSRRARDRAYVVERLIPAELGGSNGLANLWPGMKADAMLRHHVANLLRDRVCAGDVDLAAAQRAIATNWTTALFVATTTTTTTTTEPPPPPAPEFVDEPWEGGRCGPGSPPISTNDGGRLACFIQSDGSRRYERLTFRAIPYTTRPPTTLPPVTTGPYPPPVPTFPSVTTLPTSTTQPSPP